MQTDVPAIEDVNLTEVLERSAHAGDHRRFVELVKETNWSTRAPEELLKAIDLALYQEMAKLAIELAQLGGRLFPNHDRVQRAAKVLAPPVARVSRLPHPSGLDASKAWLREHASEYRGQWVAVREGQLLRAADDLDELMPLIGQDEAAINTVVTRLREWPDTQRS